MQGTTIINYENLHIGFSVSDVPNKLKMHFFTKLFILALLLMYH